MKIALKQPYRQFFGTMANQVRIDIISLLLKGKSNVSDIVAQLDYDQSTISHSLKRLRHCGFVTVKRDGKEHIYTLNKSTIQPLFKLMHAHMDKYCRNIVKEKCH